MTTARESTTTSSLAWHAERAADVLLHLDADSERGLTTEDVRRRLARVGPNRIADQLDTPLWHLALDQFKSLVVILLLVAAAIAFFLGKHIEAAAILVALLLNAAIGFGSEWRARTSLAKLRSLAVPQALAKRDGRVLRLPSADLVPGDLILLEAGAQVPADARLIDSTALRVSESALTGESDAVEKDARAELEANTPLALRRTIVYLGTTVLAGSGLAVVTATGLATELGRIGQLVALAGERTTPLERQIEALGRRLMALAVVICAVVGLAGILHGEPIGLMLETAISLAVAAIPEGLPAVTAVALAAGLWRLARRGALVRRLPAVETLGSTTVICSDKTGTMTENQMTVTRVLVGDERNITVTGSGRSATGDFVENGRGVTPSDDSELRLILTASALVNDASVHALGPDRLEPHGDPTETALLVAAVKAGLDPAGLAQAWPRLRVTPFDPVRRFMATWHLSPEHGLILLVKGAPGVILDLSRHRETKAGPVVLEDRQREQIREDNHVLADEGLRVLAVAWRRLESIDDVRIEGLTFLGLVGLVDPIRSGVKDALAQCAAAGLRTIMLTGDQAGTAFAVGRSLGLDPDAVRSRVTPEGKLTLIEELQAAGQVVAMTGDGVNDAPALARADIGIAMGRHGTDVAREAADVVLTDDDFTTIVHAVAEGRVIYANLRKVIHFLFTCNLSEILTIFVGILLGLPAPLLPLQILWVNLVTDILPALALIRDPAEPDIMRRPPRDPREALVTWRFGRRMLAEGAWLAAGVLSAYLWVVWQAGPGPRATTMAFMALVLIHPFQAMNCRSQQFGWWRLPSNALAWIALVTLVGLQWLSISFAPLSRLLGTVPLAPADWLVLATGVLWPVVGMEIVKVWGPGSFGRGFPNRVAGAPSR
jgi:Ca2+-transporting ATPase